MRDCGSELGESADAAARAEHGEASGPLFSLFDAADPLLPVLISVPHAGRDYPAEVLAQMRQPEVSAIRLEDRLVDTLAKAVAARCGAGLLIAHAPRAMIDLNRHPDDVDWTMVRGAKPDGAARHLRGGRASSGLGLVPRRLGAHGEVWKRPLTRQALDWRREHIHAAYHAKLTGALAHLRDRCGVALLIDLHSMPPLGPKTGEWAAPDFVIGDLLGTSCDWRIAALSLDHFSQAATPAAHNRPYAGGYVLERHGRPADGIHAMQIEVCRTTYLDDSLREQGAGFDAVVEVLANLVLRLAASLPQKQVFAQAAE